MEDIVEEILSDVVPRDDVALYIEPLGNGRFLVSGDARLDDLSEYLGFQIDAEGIDTIDGFVFTRLGNLNDLSAKLDIVGDSIHDRRPARHCLYVRKYSNNITLPPRDSLQIDSTST